MNRRKKGLLYFFVVLGLCSATIIYFFYRKNPIELNLFIDTGHCPSVEVYLHQQQQFLSLDTGQRLDLSLDKKALSQLNAQDTKKTDIIRNLYGDTFEQKVYLLQTLPITKWHLKNVLLTETKEPTRANNDITIHCSNNHKHVPTIGSIGMGILQKTNFLFDFGNKKLHLYPKGMIPKFVLQDYYIKAHYETHYSLPVIHLNTNYGTKKFLVDTGCSLSFLPENAINEYSNSDDCKKSKKIKLQLFDKDKKIGTKTFMFFGKNYNILNIDGIIGMDLLGHFNIFFDTQNQFIYFMKQKK